MNPYFRKPPQKDASAGLRHRGPLTTDSVAPRYLSPTDAAAEPAWMFGPFLLQERQRRLLMNGVLVHLGSRAFDLLVLLVRSNGGLLTKRKILDQVWPDIVVEENNLQVQISALRRILKQHRGWIVTIPGQGYWFTAPVIRAKGSADMASTELAVRNCIDVPRPAGAGTNEDRWHSMLALALVLLRTCAAQADPLLRQYDLLSSKPTLMEDKLQKPMTRRSDVEPRA